MDLTTLVSAVGSDVVVGVLVIVCVGIIIVVVVVVCKFAAAHIELSAIDVVHDVEIVRKFSVVIVVAVFSSVALKTLLNAVTIVATRSLASVDILIAHVLSSIVGSDCEVGVDERVHIDDVVPIVRCAASGIGIAIVGRAKAETNKTFGHDADIFFIIGVGIPLLNMVASLELEGIVLKEVGVLSVVSIIVVVVVVVVVVIVVVIVVVLERTRLLHNSTANIRVQRDLSILRVNHTAVCRSESCGKRKGQNRKTSPHHGSHGECSRKI